MICVFLPDIKDFTGIYIKKTTTGVLFKIYEIKRPRNSFFKKTCIVIIIYKFAKIFV